MNSWALIVTLGVGAVFLARGCAKLGSDELVPQIANYQLLPHRAVLPAARSLPYIEILLGASVLVAPDPRLPLATGAALLMLFAVAMGVNLVRGRHIPCGCRGGTRKITWSLAVENVIGAAMIVFVLDRAVSPAAVFLSRQSSVTPTEGLAAVLTLAVASMWGRLRGATTNSYQRLERAEQITLAAGSP